MKIKILALSLALFSITTTAEEYKSITTAGYSNLDFGSNNRDSFSTETTYYFSGKESLGPLKEFEFINKSSNLSAAYFHSDIGGKNNDDFAIAGEYISGSGLIIGANLTDIRDNSFNTAFLGYLFTPNFLTKIYNTEGDTYAEARYNHQLNTTDYIGFDFVTDERLDWQLVSSKYFSKIGENQYLTAGFSYFNNDNWDDYWKVNADFYFTKNTSIGIDYDENEDYKLGFSHFLNRNIAIEASYSTMLESVFKHPSFGSDIFTSLWNTDTDVDKFEIGLTVQL